MRRCCTPKAEDRSFIPREATSKHFTPFWIANPLTCSTTAAMHQLEHHVVPSTEGPRENSLFGAVRPAVP